MKILILALFFVSCGPTEVTVDEIHVKDSGNKTTKNVDKSQTVTINEVEREVEPEPITVEVEEIDMSFDVEFELLVSAPDTYLTKYAIYISNYNQQHTQGFKILVSSGIIGSDLDFRMRYEMTVNTDCDETGKQSKAKWIDIYAVDLKGEMTAKNRFEVPKEHTWCHHVLSE